MAAVPAQTLEAGGLKGARDLRVWGRSRQTDGCCNWPLVWVTWRRVRAGSQGTNGEQANWQVAAGKVTKGQLGFHGWPGIKKAECEMMFCIFTTKTLV